MARRFRGESTQKIDGKGRVSIPANFRRVLEAGDPDWLPDRPANLVIVYGDERRQFLECYTIAAIDEVDKAIDRMPRGSPERRYVERLFNGLSVETTVDANGRMVLPKVARDKVGLSPETEAFFIASGDTFQIWTPQDFEASQTIDVDALFAKLPEGADALMLLDSYREA